ncbi:MAG: aquaporin [Chitinophagales bacterium]|nr:aquaporin [Chitinophagales bacterium]
MKKYIAEFIGTFLLVFLGTGSVIVNVQTDGSLGLVGISFAWGLVVAALIYVFGPISGTHINPAVTISLAIGGLMPKKEVLGYLLTQIIGAIAASALLKILFPETETMGGTMPSGSVLQSFVLEFIMTFILLLTVLGITAKKETEHLTGLVVGLVIVAIILFAGPISGASINPARSIGPAVVACNLNNLWLYIVAPILGATSAVLLWKYFGTPENDTNC